MSLIGKKIAIPKTNRFSEKIPDHNCQSHGHHDYSYYQPQSAMHYHRQHYRHDRRTKQSSSKNDYDRYKEGAHGMIHNGIPTPEKHKTPIIKLENDSYSRKKPSTDSSSTFLKTETIRIKKLISLPELQ